MIWAHTPKGIFTVNSAYKVALSLVPSKTMEEASNTNNQGQFWRKIWSLNVLNKLKTFAWRASHNILPTKLNLYSRKVLDDPTCEACELAAETRGHLFWECTYARGVWEVTCIPFDNKGVHYRDFIDILWYLIFMQHVGQEVLELVVTVAWCLWHNRNKARHGSPRQSTNEILHKARTVLEDFQAAHFKRPQLTSPPNARYIPPSYPWFKINTDATVFKDLKNSGHRRCHP